MLFLFLSLLYLLTYLITRLTVFSIPQHILPYTSASWSGLPTDSRSSSSPTSADIRIKYPSSRSRWILICCLTYMLLRSLYCSLLIGCGNHRQPSLDSRFYLELFSRILSRQLHWCLIESMSLLYKEVRIG